MTSRRERAKARGRRRRRRLAVAHGVSLAVHLAPLVALVVVDWPDLDAQTALPMRRVVEVRLEARKPPKDTMFQATHDADPEEATTAVASGDAVRRQVGRVSRAQVRRTRVTRARAPQTRERRALATPTRDGHARAAPVLARRLPGRRRALASAGRTLTTARRRARLTREPAAKRASRVAAPRPAEVAPEKDPSLARKHVPMADRVVSPSRASHPDAAARPTGHQADAASPSPMLTAASRQEAPPKLAAALSPAALPPGPSAASVRRPEVAEASRPLPVAPGAQTPVPAKAAPAARFPGLRPALRTRVPARATLLAAYLRGVRERIRHQWHPAVVRSAGDGNVIWRPREVEVYMAIAPDGSIRDVHVARSCGDLSLDRAALAAARRAQPFLPPPAEILHRGVLGFTFGATALRPSPGGG